MAKESYEQLMSRIFPEGYKDPESENYFGQFLASPKHKKPKKLKPENGIFLYHADIDKKGLKQLKQCVNVYTHTFDDFVYNFQTIIDHYAKHLKASQQIFSLGQYVEFRVYEGQEPMALTLFQFFINYGLMMPLILTGYDMHDWKPWYIERFTPSIWADKMDEVLYKCRNRGNLYRFCDIITEVVYAMNMLATSAGDGLGLSISNNEFIEIAKCNKDAYESITCSYDIPKDILPPKLEEMNAIRTNDLLKYIATQKDLSLSVYADVGLFNKIQFREFAVHLNYKPNLDGKTIPYTSNTNILMGINEPQAYMVDAAGGRKAEVTKMRVSDAGTLERSMSMLLSPIRFVDNEWECSSKHYYRRTIDSYGALNKLDGRVCTLNEDSDEYLIIDPWNHTLAKKLVGRTVYLKTPITCTHPDRDKGVICSACYGKLMSSINTDIHVGRISALNSADEIQQTLLSVKHALDTHTTNVVYNESFYDYFEANSGQIRFNVDAINNGVHKRSNIKHLYLEFTISEMKKMKDGENRHFDKAFKEFVIYNEKDGTRIPIQETHGFLIYLHPEFNEDYFLPMQNFAEDVIQIPFSDLIDGDKICCNVLFEYEYDNRELTRPIITINKILGKSDTMLKYADYNECLEELIPLFMKGGIDLPDIHTEMLVAGLIAPVDGEKAVDWTKKDVKYKFNSITHAILESPSLLTGLLYRDSRQQLIGKFGTYEKTGTSCYDYYMADYKN